MNILEYENYHETITHGDIIFPYNTYLCSIPLDFPRVPLHWHDELELIYIKKGMGRITVDFREYKVKGPTLALILPGQLHSIDQLEDAFMEYENIIFNPSMLIPRQNDVTATDFLLPLMSGKVTVPTIFTPVYPSIFRVPFVYVPDLALVLEQMHAKGIYTYAAHLKGQEYYDSFSFREPTAFLIGNEGNGLSKEISDQAGQYLKIPMEGRVESLNAA